MYKKVLLFVKIARKFETGMEINNEKVTFVNCSKF
jgi:hypothetical protein